MKEKLYKLTGTVVLGLALCLQSIPTWAGSSNFPEVTIMAESPTISTASGGTAGARYSGDSRQYIGCVALHVNRNDTTSVPMIACSARDKTGKSLTCVAVEDINKGNMIVAVTKAMTDFSHISFTVDSAGSYCSQLRVTNDSMYLR